MFQAKNKPNPNPSVVPAEPSVSVIESRPPSILDFTGIYEVDAQYYARTPLNLVRKLKLAPTAKMVITVQMANNPRHVKTGRQLWATFKFGDALEGCMRFHPAVLDPEGMSKNDEPPSVFEQSCTLKNNAWPGLSPHGIPKWSMRYRARELDTGDLAGLTDCWQTQVLFEQGDDGIWRMGGPFMVGCDSLHSQAVRTGDVSPKRGSEKTVIGYWDAYKRAPSRYI